MTYRINNGNRVEFVLDNCPILTYTGDVVVAIDPSKTNMGVVVGTTGGNKLAHVELSGKGCDTTDYCLDLKKFFSAYLSRATLKIIGIEQAVQYKGYDYYHSQMVLTEIRATLLGFFLEHFHIKVMEINNYSWKGAVLPDGYRGHSEKGSKRWLAEQGITGLSDDVTDAICIYLYLLKFVGEQEDLYCNNSEEPLCACASYIYPKDTFVPDGVNVYEYNPSIPLRGNIGFYINHTVKGFVLTIPTSSLTYDLIYSSTCFFKYVEEGDKVCLFVMRC